MKNRYLVTGFAVTAVLILGAASSSDVVRTTANNGNLVMEDVPPIPEAVVEDLNRFQNVRHASLLDWSVDSRSLFVNARFSDVNQIHRVDMPMGARRQLTFFDEPIGLVKRRPGRSDLLFTRDAGGSEFAQLMMLDGESGSITMLTDGESRNGSPVWDREGRNLAFSSTRRNGASNDVWVMDGDESDSAKAVLESEDGSWWGPVEFSASGTKVLVHNYVSVSDSRVHLLDLDSGTHVLMAGGPDAVSANIPIGFDKEDEGFWFITDQNGEFRELAFKVSQADAEIEYVTASIPWNISSAAIAKDRDRMAFVANENGMSRLYLMDMSTREFRAVRNIPVGLVYGLTFSPDGSNLGMSVNTPRTPSDTFVLKLGNGALEYGPLTRWTDSEVGGLDTSSFVTPALIHYPTFDSVDGEQRMIPAWVYRPNVKGPVPVIISIHGGPESQARPYFSSTYQMWLAKLGVAVVVPNVRGSNGYGKSYLALDNGYNREDSVKDIGALLDWIREDPDLDESRVAVYGGSYGGYMVLASAVHFSDRLKAAVDVVGISSFVTFLENTQDYRRDLRRQEYGDERNPDMRRHLEKISPVNSVRKINVPMFIVQGENDPRVPVTESAQMVAALRKQGLPVWYMNALNEGHGFKKKENRDIYQQAMVLFFRQHLIGEESEPSDPGTT
jgi:dipeptidyl aminopeptidase/acylaminoacyl peptidase